MRKFKCKIRVVTTKHWRSILAFSPWIRGKYRWELIARVNCNLYLGDKSTQFVYINYLKLFKWFSNGYNPLVGFINILPNHMISGFRIIGRHFVKKLYLILLRGWLSG